jgi:hypothetical protein
MGRYWWLKRYADKMGGTMKELVGRLLSVPASVLAPKEKL